MTDLAVPAERTRCRVCGALLLPVLSLGHLHLSDFPNAPDTKAHPAVPLDLCRCSRAACGLVQLAHTTPPSWLYQQYWYRSGVNEAMVAELADIVRQAILLADPPPRSVVVDIGANDGTLLAEYTKPGNLSRHLLRVAYEPAVNLYTELRPHANVLFPHYFQIADPWKAESQARIISSIAMFYDLDDPNQFVADIGKILHPDGVWVIQQAYLPAMLQQVAVDNIGHEHLEYYDLKALEFLLDAHGLEVVDVALRAINGGSFRTYVRWKGRQAPTPAVAELRQMEAQLWRDDPSPVFAKFASRALEARRMLRDCLEAYHAEGLVVDALGASTKGNTLLQWCGIDKTWIRQAWERSEHKVGRYVGVSGIPLVSEAEGRANPPAALLCLIWQFRDMLLEREQEYLAAGGSMIVPLPALEVVRHARER